MSSRGSWSAAIALVVALAPSIATAQAGEAGGGSSGVPQDAAPPPSSGADAGVAPGATTASGTPSATTTSSTASGTPSATAPTSGTTSPAGTTAATSMGTGGRTTTTTTTTTVAATRTAGASTPRATSEARAAERRPDDDGRFIDFVFVQLEGGFSHVNLTGIARSGAGLLPSLSEYVGTGPSGGLTVGARYSVVALAAHGNIARVDGIQTATSVIGPSSSSRSGFDLGELSLEAQLRIPVPIVEPYARLGFGYAWMGGFQLNEMWRESVSQVHGYTARFGMGLDVWLGRFVTVGAGVDATVVNLRRGGVMRAGSTCPAMDPACIELTQDGDAVGFTVNAHAQVGLHF